MTLYEKAAAIAAKLEYLEPFFECSAEWVLQLASPGEIEFYYERMCVSSVQ